MPRDYYKILGVPRNATKDDIKKVPLFPKFFPPQKFFGKARILDFVAPAKPETKSGPTAS